MGGSQPRAMREAAESGTRSKHVMYCSGDLNLSIDYDCLGSCSQSCKIDGREPVRRMWYKLGSEGIFVAIIDCDQGGN